ncbi:STM4014 family protein [Paenibacillus campi]|uniref:STM4014 family protein n=1 Tax=Paenibacillus campi TaxID=3106031 RepID=UPI002AFEC6F5|nr:STM4014 family protein [Paenibacillus sp. SGZ-1009]
METTAQTGVVIPSILFGNPGNKRTSGWQQALQHHGQPAALEVSYARLLHALRAGETLPEVLDSMSKRNWQRRQAEKSAAIMSAVSVGMATGAPVSNIWMGSGTEPLLLRLDAPGDNVAVERGLIALGATDADDSLNDSLLPLPHQTVQGSIAAAEARRLEGQYGRILYPAQWFRGYCRLLSWLQTEVERHLPQAQWMNAPADIALMFDKRACSLQLAAAGIAVPATLAGDAAEQMPLRSYDELRQQMEQQRVYRVFVKLFCGSAASGVIAYQYQPRTGAEIAMTTIGKEQVGDETIFYNSGRLIRYTDHTDIRQVVDWIAAQGAHVERWVSKAALDGRVYDVRQLVCRSGTGHAVLRLSRTPITNLHLRNERLLLADAGLSDALQSAIGSTAQHALAAFPNSFCAGMDVLVPAGGGIPLIMDVNPFGDLLYHVQHQGLGTYAWELACWLQQAGKGRTDDDKYE